MKLSPKATLLAALAIALSGFATGGDPAKTLAELQRFETESIAAAQNKGPEAMREARNTLLLKAKEATKDVDPVQVDPKEGLSWAYLFRMADEEPKARIAAERFLTSQPRAEEKFAAHAVIYRAHLSKMDLEGLTKTLEVMAPANPTQGIQALYMAVDHFYAFAGKDPDVTLAFLSKFEAAIPWKEGDRSVENAYSRLASTRTELLRAANRQEEAIKALDALLVKTGEKSRVGSSIRTLKNQLSLVGKPAPALKTEKGYGSPFPGLAGLKGKVVLLDFFAHWCVPCIAAFPEVKQIYGDLKGKGLEIVGLTSYYGYYGKETNLTRDAEFAKMGDFLKEHDLPWPVQYGEAANFENYGVSGIPYVVVIDKKGIVRSIKIGYDPRKTEAFRAELEKLLSE